MNLPFSTNSWDTSTLSQNPRGEARQWPQVNIPQGLDMGFVNAVACELRTVYQAGLNKGPLQIFVYNQMSQHGFMNQAFQGALQIAVNFAFYLLTRQQMQAQGAIQKSAEKTYRGTMAIAAGQYPTLPQMLPPQVVQDLQQAGQEFTNIIQDTNNLLNGMTQYNHMPQQQQPQYGYSVAHQPQYNQAPTNYAVGNINAPTPSVNTGGVSGSSNSGRYMGAVESFDAGTGAITVQNNNNQPVVQQTQQLVTTEQSVLLPPPEDILLAPDMSNQERRWDNPTVNVQGIVAKPAHQAKDWKVSRREVEPYSINYRRKTHVLFLLQYPDGKVYQKLVQKVESMDYLDHEIDDELKRTYGPDQGMAVSTFFDKYRSDPDEVVTQSEYKDEHLKKGSMTPIFKIEDVQVATTMFEAELEAEAIVVDALELRPEDKIPAFYYNYCQIFPISQRIEVLDLIEDLNKHVDNPLYLKDRLEKALVQGQIDMRHYRLINHRLTQATRRLLEVNLSYRVLPGNFVNDIVEVMNILKNRVPEIHRAFNESFGKAIKPSITLSEMDDVKCFANNFTILSTWFDYAEIENLNLEEGPTLLLESMTPYLYKIARKLLKQQMTNCFQCKMITKDGVVLSVDEGYLEEDAILITKDKQQFI